MFAIPTNPPGTYLTLSLRNLGFSTLNVNLLTIPSMVGNMITMAAITLISENVNDRSFVAMAESVWALPFLIALRVLPAHASPWKFFVSAVVHSQRVSAAPLITTSRLFRPAFLCIHIHTQFKLPGHLETLVLWPLVL